MRGGGVSKSFKINDTEVTKIYTNFLPGKFSYINIDFDPLYDPLYNSRTHYSFINIDMNKRIMENGFI
jgi:hypothetical protein